MTNHSKKVSKAKPKQSKNANAGGKAKSIDGAYQGTAATDLMFDKFAKALYDLVGGHSEYMVQGFIEAVNRIEERKVKSLGAKATVKKTFRATATKTCLACAPEEDDASPSE